MKRDSEKIKDKIKGALYGMALGDAMGMPSELWSRKKVQNYFGEITTFLDGPPSNEVACNYHQGQFTDDTKQALIIIDSLAENNYQANYKIIARNILQWAEVIEAFKNNILGPTSKLVFQALKNNQPLPEAIKSAKSNGSAMRIAPVGALFLNDQYDKLTDFVYQINHFSHNSDVGIAGGAIIACAVNAAIYYQNFDKIISDALSVEKKAYQLGYDTFSPLISKRTEIGIAIAKKYHNNDQLFLENLYQTVGAGVEMIQSVPAALSIAYYARDPNKAALLCANLGGDTDTIGAMATAICGAYSGFNKINQDWIKQLKNSNDEDLESYFGKIIKGREILWKH